LGARKRRTGPHTKHEMRRWNAVRHRALKLPRATGGVPTGARRRTSACASFRGRGPGSRGGPDQCPACDARYAGASRGRPALPESRPDRARRGARV